MKLDLKKLAVDVTIEAVKIGIDSKPIDERTQNVTLTVQSPQVTSTASIDIRSEPSDTK
jgi:hypothetical protein